MVDGEVEILSPLCGESSLVDIQPILSRRPNYISHIVIGKIGRRVEEEVSVEHANILLVGNAAFIGRISRTHLALKSFCSNLR